MAEYNAVLSVINQAFQWVPWLIFAIALWGTVGKKFRKRYQLARRDSSLLLSHYTDGVNLYSLAQGTLPSGSHYNVVATNNGSMMYMVQLSFHSTARIVAVPTADGVPQLIPNSSGNQFEQVVLEGDFPKVFHLYASTDQKSNVQYILDPKAMAFTMDFCTTHSWEIIDDKLLIVASPAAEEVLSLDDIEQLIAEIRPRIADELGHVSNRHRLSQDSLHFLEAHCPVCSSLLVRKDNWLVCPQSHGILLTGKALSLLTSGKIEPPMDLRLAEMESAIESTRQINCPVCSSGMKVVDYLERGIAIDSCSKCHFRWLDAGEPKQLTS